MTNERSTFERDKIVSIGLNLLHNWSCDFIILYIIRLIIYKLKF